MSVLDVDVDRPSTVSVSLFGPVRHISPPSGTVAVVVVVVTSPAGHWLSSSTTKSALLGVVRWAGRSQPTQPHDRGYGDRERPVGGVMAREIEVGAAAELMPGVVRGAGRFAVGNADGNLFALTRRCRHLGADLANGTVDREGCLVCPWHGASYDVATGRMMRGPQGFFAKIPGLGAGYRLLTRVLPLGRGVLVEREGTVYVC